MSFFGELPEEEGPVLLSERRPKQGIMVFHEYKNVLKKNPSTGKKEIWKVYTRSEKEILKKGETRKAKQRVVEVEEKKPKFPEFAKVTKMPKKKGKKGKDKKEKKKPEKKVKKQPEKQNAFCVLDDSSEDEDEDTELVNIAPVQGAWSSISEKIRTPTPILSVTPTSVRARAVTPGIRTKVNTFVAGLEADIDETEEFIEMLYERLDETEDSDEREDICDQIYDYQKTLETLEKMLNASTDSDSDEESDDY